MNFRDLTLEEVQEYAEKATSIIMEEWGIDFTTASIFVLEEGVVIKEKEEEE